VKGKELKSLKALQPDGCESTTSQPRLESEPLHRRIHRLNEELRKAIEKLQTFNREWASKNVKAQACRLAIPTAEQTHAANRRRELASQIQRIQTELGDANMESRQLNAKSTHKAATDTPTLAVTPKKAVRSKRCPLKQHREWTVYFELAARDELVPDLYAQVERTAKSLLEHAIATGIEEP
jgi:hypothetical protein